jgi:hypothetical protein
MGSEQKPKKYRVRLGFVEVLVECQSKEEAIPLAREKLSSDWPRLYDVIHRADDKQFQVSELEHDTPP